MIKMLNDVTVKGILVAGGSGTRLMPFTKYTHKTLLPLYDMPVIDYALSTMRKSGINDIIIIANRHLGQIAEHIGSGLVHERIHYVIEDEPKGISNAINLARPYVNGERIMLYFSDNITTLNFKSDVDFFKESREPPGAILLAREVENPESFGVCQLDNNGNIIDIEEKPINPSSNLAIGGIYLFDELFWKYLDEESEKLGEDFSISAITRKYVKNKNAKVRNIGKGTWVDCGTPDGLLQASLMAKNKEITTRRD